MNRRILLADDSLTIQKVVELTFMDEDFDVVAVGNGDEAIAGLEAEPLDILIADVHMPGPSGYEVCRAAKQVLPSLPVLLLVGTFETLDEDEMAACGADGYLKKPFDSQELLELVRAMISGDRAPASSAPQDAPAAGFDLGTAQELATSLDEVDPAEADLSPEDLGGSIELGTAVAVDEIAAMADDELGVSGPRDPEIEDEAAEIPVLSQDSSDELESGDEPITDWELSSHVPPPPESPTLEPTAAELPEDPLPAPETVEPQETETPVAEAAIVAPEGVSEPGTAAANGRSEDHGLSDEDVERVARRVVEMLADDTIREVAWDVVPDMAEIVIKDRIRELEAEAE